MIIYDLARISAVTNTTLVGENRSVLAFLTDSRSLQHPEETLFIALKSERNNGHAYIESLIKKGVKCFLVSQSFDLAAYDQLDVSFIVSANTLHTLQKFASWHRRQFSLPIIGITGSNGKTVVKEWLYQLLKNHFTICRSPKSYNSQVGVPLSILNLSKEHTLGIFEAGISQAGEMARLSEIINPTFGILTSFGSAHDEGFESPAAKLAEKLKLFNSASLIVVNGVGKNTLPAEYAERTIFVSSEPEAGLRFTNQGNRISFTYQQTGFEAVIPFSDDASVCNAATCAAVMLQLGIGTQEVSEKLALLQPVALRLEIRNAINNALIINDYYNSDLDSLKIALNYLHHQNRRPGKIVIVSDIEQSGLPPDKLYRQVAALCAQAGIDLLVGIGNEIGKHSNYFKGGWVHYESTRDFIAEFAALKDQLANATILLKGARSFGFENISSLLELKSHDTVFEINLNKLTDNVNYYRSLIGANVRIMGMVKAMGYGSGSSEIAKTLQHIGVGWLAVAYADEGVELRQSRVDLPIMVMSPEENAFSDMLTHRLEPEIYSMRILDAFVKKLDAMGIVEPYPVHLKIDTGMNRLGFVTGEIQQLAEKLSGLPQLKVSSIFSHLAASDNAMQDEFTQKQVAVFESAFTLLEKKLGYQAIKHICNSGGISRFKNAHYDMVRLGIGMYGIGVNENEQFKLQNVGILKTRVSQVKMVKAGESVGYNRKGQVSRDTRIGVIPIGYADGFSRLLGNGNHGVYIDGKFCKTIGNICMDMCMVDVSEVKCSEGDEAIIFESVAQINALAAALNTIPYEVLTNVSGRVKRVYVQE
jgi:alanine racemase